MSEKEENLELFKVHGMKLCYENKEAYCFSYQEINFVRLDKKDCHWDENGCLLLDYNTIIESEILLFTNPKVTSDNNKRINIKTSDRVLIIETLTVEIPFDATSISKEEYFNNLKLGYSEGEVSIISSDGRVETKIATVNEFGNITNVVKILNQPTPINPSVHIPDRTDAKVIVVETHTAMSFEPIEEVLKNYKVGDLIDLSFWEWKTTFSLETC